MTPGGFKTPDNPYSPLAFARPRLNSYYLVDLSKFLGFSKPKSPKKPVKPGN
jgi:hypothetical protein